MYIISGCLLGNNCKYDGGNNYNKKVTEFVKGHNIYIACPEIAGGWPAPRPPAERVGDKVMNAEGKDVTKSFVGGALICLAQAEKAAREIGEEIEGAILKAKSPTCGSGIIYDGTFSHVEIAGDGVFAELLKEKGIKVITEKEI